MGLEMAPVRSMNNHIGETREEIRRKESLRDSFYLKDKRGEFCKFNHKIDVLEALRSGNYFPIEDEAAPKKEYEIPEEIVREVTIVTSPFSEEKPEEIEEEFLETSEENQGELFHERDENF